MIVDEEIVDRTWKEVAAYSPAKMAREAQKYAKKQPFLMAFVMANSEDMRTEVSELVFYLSFVVGKMFEKSCKLPAVSSEIIMKIDEQNYHSLGILAGENFLDELAKFPSMLRQRPVFLYVTSVLCEEDPEVVLTAEEEGFVFVLLKTVIDSLDKVTEEMREFE
jgi:hypothetical protein